VANLTLTEFATAVLRVSDRALTLNAPQKALLKFIQDNPNCRMRIIWPRPAKFELLRKSSVSETFTE